MPNTYTLIASNTVGSGGVSSVTFSSIPATYTDLLVKLSGRCTTGTTRNLYMNLNSDTGSNYPFRFLYGNGSSAGSSNSTSEGFSDVAWVGYLGGSTITASTFGNVEIYIPNYAGATYKSISSDSVYENNATAAYASMHAAIWNSTSAITSLTLKANSGNLAEFSTATLYGISKT